MLTSLSVFLSVSVSVSCEEGWAPKNWCFWTVVLEKTLESPLDCKEIQSIHSKGDQPWVFFGRNDAKAETPVLWPPHARSWLIGKDSDAGRDWRQEEKGTTEDEMAGWHHRLHGCEFEWTPGVGDGQGGLACCDSWGHKESDTTERLIWSDTSLHEFTLPPIRKQHYRVVTHLWIFLSCPSQTSPGIWQTLSLRQRNTLSLCQLYCVACGTWVPRPQIEPRPLPVRA